MIAAVFLLCAFNLHFSGHAAANNHPCVPGPEVACFAPVNLASNPVDLEVCVGKKLIISLEHVPDYLRCYWFKGVDLILTVNESRSMVFPPLSEKDSGEYTLRCKIHNEIRTSLTVFLHVIMDRPTKPLLMLDRVQDEKRSPYFTCTSKGCPEPILEWFGKEEIDEPEKSGKANITISSTNFASEMMCCATNAEGQECSQLYDYDVGQNFATNDNDANVTVSPGQPLLLRCRMKWFKGLSPVWENGSNTMNAKELACPVKVNEELCIRNDSHDLNSMAYLFFKSVSVYHSGTYTCRSPKNKKKSIYIHVQAEDFLSVQLDPRMIISALNASTSCLRASVSYHPVLQKCSWEAPDKTLTKCVRETRVIKHSTVKLCEPLKTGDYKLHLEAGDKKDTKTIAVCVVDTPKFHFWSNEAKDTFTFETMSLVPANYTWLSCSLSNDSGCEEDSSWKTIPNASQTDSDVLCKKRIQSSLSRDLVVGQHIRFCLTNSVGSWCQTRYSINISSAFNTFTGVPHSSGSTVLKVGSIILVLGLALVAVVIVYFVRNKKHRYQPQLQMIQMVGPNDNDYIYINFRDFVYDLKWEFPRENLKLGDILGSGAFGMVVQATAFGIRKPGVSQQVAVKMLKEKHQTVEKEALMSELKMLTHIGHHANIVNLLGACTESAPTYLIFQYCCYGDLLNYLKLNRERYNNSVTDTFNKDHFSSPYHNLKHRKNSSNPETAIDNYVPMNGSPTREQYDTTLKPNPADSLEDPEVCDSFHDENEDLQDLTFDDLLSFASQVAKGMDFLSSKNCIHRDLAARNVLVTNGRRVKIGDFGLARDIDNDSNYVVKGNVRLPVKWMAPESIFQGVYTTKSDVWAYGILLWEIFSLGVTPYSGMKVDPKFYSMIKKGFKMECPPYANESVYGIMCKCWALDPHNRPPFSKLLLVLCDQLTDKAEKLYLYMHDQTSSDYQNAPVILNASASTKENEGKTQSANEYCQTFTTEGSEAETPESDVMAVEEKLLKPNDSE